MLEELLLSRNLPPLRTREEMMEILQREEYGYLPAKGDFSAGEPQIIEARFAGSTCPMDKLPFTVCNEKGSHTFPLYRLMHNDGKKHPVIIYMNFHPLDASFYFPAELIAESQFDVLGFNYKDATSDNFDFTTGVAPLLGGFPSGPSAPGKIAMWAWTAMRVMDYAETLPTLDTTNAAIAGHSRLGKTALYAGMMDERFKFVLSSDAGCSGDNLAIGGTGRLNTEDRYMPGVGESIRAILNNFSYWFCNNYKKYYDGNLPVGFDQHYLLASIAPRYVCVAAENGDPWYDRQSQQLCCLAAGKMWENMGLSGYVHDDRFHETGGDKLLDGHVGFTMRAGSHFMSYRTWMGFMEFIEKHMND